MLRSFLKNLPFILLVLFVTLYGTYFSVFTVKRYEKMYAHYFDLGIMHQTVYNTYKGIQTADVSRILELTNPHQKPNQIKRMAIHNDILLAVLAPFYFIHAGPETLLVIQSIVLAAGAVILFFIIREIVQKFRYSDFIALVFSVSYLLYYPLQKANKYEFHAVTLATTLLLAMYYAYLRRRYFWSTVFAVLAIFSKEQVGLTVAMFSGFILFQEYRREPRNKNPVHRFVLQLLVGSILWVLLSMLVIIPFFRGGEHFASEYFTYLKEAPWLIWYPLVDPQRYRYLYELLSPVAFLPLLSPLHLLIALPDLLINILSGNDSMRNTYFHYNSVITPFVFIAAGYGFRNAVQYISRKTKQSINLTGLIVVILLLTVSIWSSFTQSPAHYSLKADAAPWLAPRDKIEDILYWKEQLKNETYKVSTTGQMAPFFTSRRYFYDFNYTYTNADYIVLDRHDVQYGFMRKHSYPAYSDLLNDPKYIKIYDRHEIEVYKKI